MDSEKNKIEQGRNEILSAAMALFQHHGLDKTTMEDIAEAVGKSKSTLYYYFKTKEDVFYAVVCKERESAFAELEKAVTAHDNAPDKLRALFTCHRKIVRTKVRIYLQIIKENRKHLEFFERMRRENNMVEVELLQRILEEGIASGDFSRIKKEDCRDIAITCMSALHGVNLHLLLGNGTDNDKTEILSEIFIRGLR